MSIAATVPKPDHVPAALVRDFDYRDFPGHDRDVHLAWKQVEIEAVRGLELTVRR